MRVPAFMLVMLCAAAGLGGCVPDVVSLEAVPTPSSRAIWRSATRTPPTRAFWDNAVKRCMKAKGYRFLRQY